MYQVLRLLAWLSRPVWGLMNMLLLWSFMAEAQHSNVVISTAANANGSWSFASNTYTFIPTADNAVINNVTLQSYLVNYSVEIKTARAGGTQVGSVVFDAGVSMTNGQNTNSLKGLTVTSGGEVQFNSGLTMRLSTSYVSYVGYDLTVNAGGSVRIGGVLDVGSWDNNSIRNPVRPGNVRMVVGGDLVLSGSGQVLSKGWRNVVVSSDYNGGVGGSQSYVVSGGIEMAVGSVLNSVGGNSDRGGNYYTVAGSGGSISLSGVNGVLLRGSIQSG
ncbi:hypothetical protein, partial [Aquirufa sp.]|uniref:hypothetical protein n=1 Tax=Aquirufa sp. TaxID=2676249 RepID=UPI0037C001AF